MTGKWAWLQHAAREVLWLRDHGAPVSEATTAWANWAVNHKPHMPPVPKAHKRERVLDAMRNCPPEGMLARDVAAATGVSQNKVADLLWTLVRTRRLWWIKIPGRSRYFPSRDARDIGMPLVMAMERKRRGRPAPKPERPPKPPKPAKVVRADAPVKAFLPVTTLRKDLPVVVPDHVKVQVCPSSKDTRFAAIEPYPTPFSDEWVRLRGGKR